MDKNVRPVSVESKADATLLQNDEPMRFVTMRAIGISCALIPLLALWVVQSELVWYTGHSTAISLFYHVVFTIFLIALANLWVGKRWPAWKLSPGELMTIYVMLSVAGTLCSHDMLQIFVPMMTYPKYAANPQNRWDTIMLPHLPKWAMVTDKEAISGLAVGNASLYRMNIVLAWLKPLLFWSLFLLCLMLALQFLNVFFRKAWTEKERLSFPVIQIPLLISFRLTELLKNKLFWIAFGTVALIDILNGLSFLFPSIPSIPVVRAFEFREYFVERPWSAIAGTTINLYPFVIGLAFFLRTDLAFSCWFFYLFFKVQIVLTSAIGIQDIPGFPFPNQQAAGGYMALCLFAMWLSRRHLRGIWRTILGKPGGLDDSDEPVRYRTALFGFLICTAILVVSGMLLGGSLGVMLSFFVIFFMYSIAIARMRAELGPPAHDLHFMGPGMVIHDAIGSRGLSEGNLTAFSFFFWFNRAYRAHFSAHSIEAFKIGQVTRVAARSMMFAVIIALIVGMVGAYWAGLHALYVHGYSGKPAGDAFASQGWNRLAGWLNFPQESNGPATFATVAGLVFSLFLGLMRTKFSWWVWHPVGYATSTCWSMEKLWACIFLAWVAKALITRYGGAVAYRKALPFFVGLVLGEFMVGSLWCIYGAILGTPVYHFWG